MSSEQSETMILVIGVRDDFLHAYHDEREMLADNNICARAVKKFGALEFFDSEGYRLAGEYDDQWRMMRLARTGESPDPAQLLQRMQNSLDNLRWYVKNHPAEFESYQMTVDDALALCLNLDGPTDLKTAVQALATHFGRSGQKRIAGDYWEGFCRTTGWC